MQPYDNKPILIVYAVTNIYTYGSAPDHSYAYSSDSIVPILPMIIDITLIILILLYHLSNQYDHVLKRTTRHYSVEIALALQGWVGGSIYSNCWLF